MLIATETTNVKRGGDSAIKESTFVIDDPIFVMEMLENRLYSNKIRTICQEIMSNARDAHRELGVDDTPIEVQLPNQLDPRWIVRDFGIGISPDRMEKIFVRYGASSKRSDNEQTGGFGIGAKTPWAYLNQYGIISIVPEKEFYKDGIAYHDVLVKRVYNAYKNEIKAGKLALLSEEVTCEPRGTTIILAVRPEDYNNFKIYTKLAADYWDTRPVITGSDNFEWARLEVVYEGENWEVLKSQYNNHDFNKPLAIVDGIPYPMSYGSIFDGQNNNEISKLFQYPVRVYFKTGEVSLTVNREEIDYGRTNKNYIIQRLKDALAGIREEFEKMIAAAPDLWQANLMWKRAKREGYGQIIDSVEWKGRKITGNQILVHKTGCYVFWLTKVNNKFGGQSIKRVSTDGGVIDFEENSIFCVDDTHDNFPSRARALTLFNANPACTKIQVLVYGVDIEQQAELIKELEEKYDISLMSPIRLSTVDKSRKARGSNGTGNIAPVLAQQFTVYGSRKRDSWQGVEVDMDTDGGYYVNLDRYAATLPDCGKEISTTLMAELSKMGINIYGFTKSFMKAYLKGAEELSADWVPLDVAIRLKIKEIEADTVFMESYHNVQDRYDTMNYVCGGIYNYIKKNKFQELVIDKDSLSIKYFESSEKAVKFADVKTDKLTELYSMLREDPPVREKSFDLSKLRKNFAKRYPLIVGRGEYEMDGISRDHVARYINDCDKNVED